VMWTPVQASHMISSFIAVSMQSTPLPAVGARVGS
jgi:hypothetical protein